MTMQAALFDDEAQGTLDIPKLKEVSSFDRFLAFRTRPKLKDGVVGLGKPSYAKSSEKIYRFMWTRFETYLNGRGIPVAAATAEHIQSFLRSVDAASSARSPTPSRYLAIIEDVYSAFVADEECAHNPAADVSMGKQYTREMNMADPVVALTEEEELRFLQFLGPAPEAGHWRAYRNWVITRLILASGLKASEAISLRFESGIEWFDDSSRTTRLTMEPRFGATVEPLPPGRPRFRLPESGLLEARTVPLANHFVTEFRNYLVFIRALVPSDFVFPGSVAGDDAVSKSAVYTYIDEAFAQSEIHKVRTGAQVLRDTFALRQLQHGVDDHLVAQLMGFRDVGTLEKYKTVVRVERSIVDLPVPVVPTSSSSANANPPSVSNRLRG